jgi:hypothetical protein
LGGGGGFGGPQARDPAWEERRSNDGQISIPWLGSTSSRGWPRGALKVIKHVEWVRLLPRIGLVFEKIQSLCWVSCVSWAGSEGYGTLITKGAGNTENRQRTEELKSIRTGTAENPTDKGRQAATSCQVNKYRERKRTDCTIRTPGI